MLVCSLPTPLAKISPIDNHQVKYEDMQHLMFGHEAGERRPSPLDLYLQGPGGSAS